MQTITGPLRCRFRVPPPKGPEESDIVYHRLLRAPKKYDARFPLTMEVDVHFCSCEEEVIDGMGRNQGGNW